MRPGEGRMEQCLQQHEAELSAACGEQRKALQERADRFNQACKADMEKYCKDVKLGGGRALSCLKRREADLSEACRAEVRTSKAEVQRRKQ